MPLAIALSDKRDKFVSDKRDKFGKSAARKKLLTKTGNGCIFAVLTVLIQLLAQRGEEMLTINYRDPRPIYEQIMDELRKMIISGVFAPDEKLPSVRDLAQQLAINPNTIQRAYRELELTGYIYSVAGKGNFAAEKHEVDESRRAALLAQLAETVKELRFLGVGDAEIAECLKGGRNDD